MQIIQQGLEFIIGNQVRAIFSACFFSRGLRLLSIWRSRTTKLSLAMQVVQQGLEFIISNIFAFTTAFGVLGGFRLSCPTGLRHGI